MYISRTKGEILETKGKDFHELTIRGSVPSARSRKLSSASNIEPTMDIPGILGSASRCFES